MLSDGTSATVRGAVTDRPWGITLGALGVEARTVQLTLRAGEDKIYRIVFDRGVVVAASSPHPSDAVTRVALTSHQITPAQVNDVKRRILAAPSLDEVDVLAAAVRLTADQARALRIRLVTQRAARTFAIDRAEYEIEDREPFPVAEGGIDIRSVIYMGVRMNLSDERLAYDLRQLGTRFKLEAAAEDELSRFGFTRAERPILDALKLGTSLPELEAVNREIDPRAAQAVVYALACCGVLRQLAPPAKRLELPLPADPPLDPPTPIPVAHDFEDSIATRLAKGTTLAPPPPRPTVPRDVHSMQTQPLPRAMIESFRTGKMTTIRPNALSAHEVEELIAQRTELLDVGADHFTLLGVSIGAPIEEIHAAYVELSRHLRPQRLTELGIQDEGFAAQRLLAQIGIAFTVLTDRVRRPEYMATLRSTRRRETQPPR